MFIKVFYLPTDPQ